MRIRIALAGNPNAGKTTLFNQLTGSKQHVGNWPGVTVEKKEGSFKIGNDDAAIVDLPGIYSLSAYSIEEKVARDFICNEHPDVILNIIDGTNIERNLYLSLQLLELGIPVVIAVNMTDEMTAKGEKMDYGGMREAFGVSFVPISARRGEGLDKLKQELLSAVGNPPKDKIIYAEATRNALDAISREIENIGGYDKTHINFYCARLLNREEEVAQELSLSDEVKSRIDDIIRRYENTSQYGDSTTMLADDRYRYITKQTDRFVIKDRNIGKLTLSDKIDSVVTNKYLAIPTFFVIMGAMFLFTFGPIGEWLKSLMDYILGDIITIWVVNGLQNVQAPEWTISLIIDGVITGVGGILSFMPQIMLLFLFLSILEDSGYMSRAAFIMDKLLRHIGLSGKSFIPMLMGFGCTVPAVMAARTMENEKDRRLTIMLTPFMSCGARLPVYALFTGVFFPAYKGIVIFSMYILGMAVAILCGYILKNTLFKGERPTFILELPPYRLPSFKSTLHHMWEKAKGFLIKAGTIIFSMSVIVWIFQNLSFSLRLVDNNADSIFGVLGSVIAPVFTPLGFGTWQATVSLFSGFVAKEAVVTTMMVLYGAGDPQALSNILATLFTPLSAYSFMVFTLLYVPCVAAFSTIKKEMNSWKWALGSAAFQTGVAYIAAFLVYQIGGLFF